jgi:putative ABC transport system substrate-binding protein
MWVVGLVLGVVLLGLAPGADAQQDRRIYRIGYLTVPSRESAQEAADNFARALRELGWVEGKNIAIEYRFAGGSYDRLPGLAAELARLKTDVFVTGATPAAVAARDASRLTPVVSMFTSDPVGAGLATSLARPGGTVTGLTVAAGPELTGKQLELLKSAVPSMSRIAILVNPASPTRDRFVSQAEAAARTLGLKHQVVDLREPRRFDAVFATLATSRTEAAFAPSDSMFYQHRDRLAELAAKHRVPVMWGLKDHAEAGGLMAYSVNLMDLTRRAASYVDKILKGAKPGDLPFEQPTKFDFVINLKAAKALGLTIPQPVLLRADQVIQ